MATRIRDSGIAAVCFTCNESRRFPYQSLRDAKEYDRFANDCVREFGASHPCIEPGRIIGIQSFGPPIPEEVS